MPVLFDGDLTDFGREQEYDNLARFLAPLSMPWFLMPGNHDDPATLRRKFPSHRYLAQRAGKIDYVIDEFPVRIVALDSTVPRESAGALDTSQLAWLDDTLAAAPRKPTIVALHHAPFWTGIGHMDGISLADPSALEAVIARHRQVERVLWDTCIARSSRVSVDHRIHGAQSGAPGGVGVFPTRRHPVS